MADLIQMDYNAMYEMSSMCREVSSFLEDLKKDLLMVATSIDGGVLVGKAGTALSEGISKNLVSNIKKLQDHFDEVANDLIGAVSDMQSSDSKSGKFFKS